MLTRILYHLRAQLEHRPLVLEREELGERRLLPPLGQPAAARDEARPGGVAPPHPLDEERTLLTAAHTLMLDCGVMKDAVELFKCAHAFLRRGAPRAEGGSCMLMRSACHNTY